MWRVLILVVTLWAQPVWAQSALEVIALRHQTVDRVLPVLQPLLEPGGTLSGMDNQLFLRASPRNREEIKRALAAIDKPLRRLVIQVSQTRGAEGGSRRGDANAQMWATRSEGSSQRVQTVDGGRAFIQVGYSVPFPLRQVVMGPGGAVVADTMVYRDIGQGFYAEPQVNGDRVTLEISQEAASPGGYGAGSASVQRLSTSLSGRLGEWMELGGSGRQAAGSGAGGWSYSTGQVRESRSIWLMVEEIR
ncbi:MAG: hypothetical protein H6R10_1076 [Rhodocyclaceae bacterium]|nr:hypothetical protein [Rhodocyclaceae bacterium]